MIKVGVIGYGYWGPNVARNFNLPGVSEVIAIADKSEKSQKRAAEAFPHIKVVGDAQEILSNHRNRCCCRRNSGMDALRAGQSRAESRQARICRKAFHRECCPGRRTD